jgi:hypothetical protein
MCDIQVQQTAKNVDGAVRDLPDANLTPEDLWANHSKFVYPKPHMRNCVTWSAMIKVRSTGQKIGLKDFKPIKPLGSGDTGRLCKDWLINTPFSSFLS